MGEEEKTITLEELDKYEATRCDVQPYRWGHCCRYLVNIDGKRYLTDYIYYHCQEGCELDYDDKIKIRPAKVITKEVWVREDET